ncbi:MAG: hydantoinase/oxoprolinase family protein [Candidatus Nanopelagicales bacterium]
MTQGTRVAIDVGGTFTDVVSLREGTGSLAFDKVPTTPSDPQQGVLDGFAATAVPLEEITTFVHGTTLGLNALLTRRGAKTGIVTTEGFRDVYLLGRTARTPMYDFKYRKPESLVARYDIFEVSGRLDFEGRELVEFDEARARAIAQEIVEHGLEAVAICFLHSYVNPDHEERMARILAEVAPQVEVTRSSALSREIREYERTSTAVLDAYIKPIVRRYLGKLSGSLADGGFGGQFLMTRSGGGAMTAATVQEAPVNLILSGPAGGVLGASWFATATNHPNLITIDMGGTSLDASLVVDGQPLTYYDASFEELPINLASLYIHTIGAGGGSLVWIDEGNHLQVGPASAGADPGPAAYGRGGTQATFTDAALHVGFLGNDAALAGTLSLDPALAEQALQSSAKALGMSVDDVALGVVRISTTKIVGAVRAITVELGHNPVDFALMSFGGGGGLVAVDVARELSIPTVIIPPGPGAFCAFGMLMANVQHDFSRTRMSLLEYVDTAVVAQEFADMKAEGDAALEVEGFGADSRTFAQFVDLRYAGQEHSVTLPVEGAFGPAEVKRLHNAFAEAHERAYGHTMTDPIELVAVRLSATGVVEPPTLPQVASGSGSPSPRSERMVYRDGNRMAYRVFHRDDFGRGDEITGPAIINEHTSTTVLHPGDSATIGALGEIVISVGKEG